MLIEIEGGRIDRVAESERVRVVVDGAELLLPAGSVVVPGFVDTHCHLMGLGEMSERVQLGGVRTAADCIARVALRALSTPPGEWILGFGWNEIEWLDRARPSLPPLDAAVPDHPVALYRIDTHAVWLNSAALAAARIEPHAIAGGEIAVDDGGRPSGLLIDNAVRLLDDVIPRPDAARMRRWITAAVDRCLALGLTEVHDMNVGLDAAVAAAESRSLRLRSSVFLEGMENEWRGFGAPRRLAPTLDVVGVKYFTDGALGSRGAWLLEPYADAPTTGLQLIEREELAARAIEAASVGHAIATHAIGDAANRLALDAYASVRRARPDALLRIEHAQIVHPDDVPRFAAIDVVAAVQPTHCTSDAPMALARLGPERCAHAYRWRSLIDAGATIVGGSDFPIESPDPLAGLRAFVRREATAGSGAWYGDEAIDRTSAIDAFTARAHSGRPGAPPRGRLAPGYDADLVVLSGDPLDEMTVVLYTIVAGRVEYEGA